jgi:hypothetical protein
MPTLNGINASKIVPVASQFRQMPDDEVGQQWG